MTWNWNFPETITNTNFKIGQKVRILREINGAQNCYGWKEGEIGFVECDLDIYVLISRDKTTESTELKSTWFFKDPSSIWRISDLEILEEEE
jgi:hypothetical protein